MNTHKKFIIILSLLLFSCGSALQSDKGTDPEPDINSIVYHPSVQMAWFIEEKII